jgi:predicted short-subunit dehydrogenase-like oxidoreductase (DUF2520 family)
MAGKKRFTVGIIGGGKVGSVLGKLLSRRGQKLACVVSRTSESARSAARFAGCRSWSTSPEALPSDVNLLILAVPHEAIASVATSLGLLEHLRFKKLSVCHTSGMLTSSVLAPLARRGARVFSFHPLQTFPRDFNPGMIVSTIPGIYYGVDGSDGAMRTARVLAGILGGKVLQIPPGMRELYHASCVVASNHLTTMLWVLQEMFEAITAKKKGFLDVYRPIIEATIRNVAATSPALALSGPVARGGVGTVAGHLSSVERSVQGILPYFLTMTEETTRLAIVKGSITADQAAAMNGVVQSFRSRLASSLEVL